jgi:hypothetical protein
MTPITFLLDSNGYNGLLARQGDQAFERLLAATNSGKLIQLVGHVVVPELWGCLEKPDNWDRCDKLGNLILYLKTLPGRAPGFHMVSRLFHAPVERAEMEEIRGGPLELASLIEEALYHTYHCVLATKPLTQKNRQIQEEARRKYREWREKAKADDKKIKMDLSLLTLKELEELPEDPRQLAIEILRRHGHVEPSQGGFDRMPTLWTWGCYTALMFCERHRLLREGQTDSTPHHGTGDYYFVLDSAYADLFVTGDKQLKNRMLKLTKEWRLIDRPREVLDPEEFLSRVDLFASA